METNPKSKKRERRAQIEAALTAGRGGGRLQPMLLLLTDLEHLGQTALQDFEREVARASGAAQADLEKHAQRLEAKLEQLYAVAATMAQREESLEGVAAIWEGMVSICDRMATALSDLHQGVRPRLESYDRILDIRNSCEENRALHA